MVHTKESPYAHLFEAIDFNLHRSAFQLNAVEPGNRSLRLLLRFKQNRTPPFGSTGVVMARGLGVHDGADLLEHLSQIVRGCRPRQVSLHNLSTRTVFRSDFSRWLRRRRPARSFRAHDDRSRSALGVVQRLDARVGGFFAREINQRPPFGSPAGLSGNFTSQHRVPDRLAVFNQRLFVGLPRQVPDVASAPFLRFRQVGRSLHRRGSSRGGFRRLR